jgi:hypothetical protein
MRDINARSVVGPDETVDGFRDCSFRPLGHLPERQVRGSCRGAEAPDALQDATGLLVGLVRVRGVARTQRRKKNACPVNHLAGGTSGGRRPLAARGHDIHEIARTLQPRGTTPTLDSADFV